MAQRGSSSGRRGNSKNKGSKFKGKRGMGILRTRPSFCRFCRDKTKQIEYKNLGILEKMVNDRGKILTRRATGNCAKHQRQVAAAIKRARFISLIPYVK